MQPLSFTAAVEKLSAYDIKQQQIYLIDLVLLCEMAWADGKIQQAERAILFNYLNHHVDSINRLAGCKILGYDEATQFVARFLDHRPDPRMLTTIRELIPAIRLENKDFEVAERTRLDILNACLDIAASSVTKYPYGLKERFTIEEKAYYHKIASILAGNPLETHYKEVS